MARYIDADKLLKDLPNDLPYKGSVKRVLMQAPIADVVEVKHGEWIWTENGEADYEQFWVCSVCGEKSYIETKFCSDCGAKMDGGRAE